MSCVGSNAAGGATGIPAFGLSARIRFMRSKQAPASGLASGECCQHLLAREQGRREANLRYKRLKVGAGISRERRALLFRHFHHYLYRSDIGILPWSAADYHGKHQHAEAVNVNLRVIIFAVKNFWGAVGRLILLAWENGVDTCSSYSSHGHGARFFSRDTEIGYTWIVGCVKLEERMSHRSFLRITKIFPGFKSR